MLDSSRGLPVTVFFVRCFTLYKGFSLPVIELSLFKTFFSCRTSSKSLENFSPRAPPTSCLDGQELGPKAMLSTLSTCGLNVNHIDNSRQRWLHNILPQLPSNTSRALLIERSDFATVGRMITNIDFVSSTLSITHVEKH